MKNFNSIYSNEENESHELNFKAEKSCTEKRCEVISINVEVNDNDTKRKCRTSTAYRIKPVISSFAHFIRIICFVFRFFFWVWRQHHDTNLSLLPFSCICKSCQTVFDRCCTLHSNKRLNDLNVVCFYFGGFL